MPAPAVYVLAVVGTVSAVLAFKEFVYEPHIAPAIDRWYIEYQAARMRRQRQAAVVSAAPEDDVPMSQTTKDDRKTRKPKSRSSAKYSDTDTSSDDEASTSGVDGNRLTKDGLLRRPLKPRGYERLQDSPAPPVIELDDLVAREVREWRNGPGETPFPGQTLRRRKNANTNVAEHAMDESIHAIPYTPLSPSRTHVLFDSSSSPVSTTPTSTGSRAPSPPLPSLPTQGSPLLNPPHPLSFSMTPKDLINGDLPFPPQRPLQNTMSPVPSAPQARNLQLLSPLSTTLPSPRLGSPFQQSIERSPLFSPPPVTAQTIVLLPGRNPPSANGSSPVSSAQSQPQISASSIYSQAIPSLSQSYPQDLDYEHGLELLSPPSSRSMSPFSMAGLSPNLNAGGSTNGNGHGIRVLSPSSTGSLSPAVASSAFSSALSSPALGTGRSPLAMDLGNESFDTVSPVGQARQLQVVSPPALVPMQDVSATSSARSTTYLSFDDDDELASESSVGSPVQYPSLQPQQQARIPSISYAHSPRSSSPLPGASHSLLFTDDSMTGAGQTQTPTQGSIITPHASRVVFGPRSPEAYQAQASPQLRSPGVDSLSDLDFLSESSASEFEFDYVLSEPSDLGNESAGEGRPMSPGGRSESGMSEAGSDGWSMPRAPPGPSSAGRNEDHMATVRGMRRFGRR